MNANAVAIGSLSVEFGTPERVEWHLDNWSRWMDSGRGVEGFAHESSGVTGGGSSQHFDDMVEASDRRCAAIVNTIIDDLPSIQQMAIYHQYLAAVFHFGRADLPTLLDAARTKIGASLKAKGVW